MEQSAFQHAGYQTVILCNGPSKHGNVAEHITVKDEVSALELRKTELQHKLDVIPQPKPLLHPCLAEVYRNKVDNLVEALNDPDTVTAAAEAIRDLVEAVRLVPEEGELKIEIYGELAALISLGQEQKNKHPGGNTSGVQVTLVAGARNCLNLLLFISGLKVGATAS